MLSGGLSERNKFSANKLKIFLKPFLSLFLSEIMFLSSDNAFIYSINIEALYSTDISLIEEFECSLGGST